MKSDLRDALREQVVLTLAAMSGQQPTMMERIERSVERAGMSEAEKDARWKFLVDLQKADGLCCYVDSKTLEACYKKPFHPKADYCREHNLDLGFEMLMGRL